MKCSWCDATAYYTSDLAKARMACSKHHPELLAYMKTKMPSVSKSGDEGTRTRRELSKRQLKAGKR